MAFFWRTSQRQRQANWLLAAFSGLHTAPIGRQSATQWVVVSIMAILLGIFVVGVSALPSGWASLFALAVLFPFIAMIVGNMRKLLLAIIIFDIPLGLDIHLAYRAEVAEIGALGGFGVSATTMCLIALYGLWVSERLAKVGPLSNCSLRLRLSLPLTLYLAFVALSTLVAYDVIFSLFELFMFLQMALFYIYIASTMRTRDDVLFIVTLLFISLAIESIIIIGLGLTGQHFSIGPISTRIDGGTNLGGQFSRIGGTVGSPNHAASYLSLHLAPAIGVLLARLEYRYKCLAMIALSLGMIALVFTLSRGGWIASALSIMIMGLLAWHRGWLSLKIPFLTAITILLLSLLFRDIITARLFSDDGGAAYSRIPLMKLAIQVIMDHPVLGVGANNFMIVIEQYMTPEFSGTWIYDVHNKYLLVWAETGIGGLITFLLFLLITIHWGWQCWKADDRFVSPLALGFTAAIIGHMVHMQGDLFNDRIPLQLVLLLAGLITVLRAMGVQDQQCNSIRS